MEIDKASKISPAKNQSDLKEAPAGSSKDTDKPKACELTDSKPRIVLTFRSEKPGLKSNMKIVSNESAKSSSADNSITDEETYESPPSKKRNITYESDEGASDTSNIAPKRSARNRNKEYSDNILYNAIARKEKEYNQLNPDSHRPSKRPRPPAKVANKELLQLGIDIHNNSHLSMINSDHSTEEGVQTRRSLRCRSGDPVAIEEKTPDTTPKKGKPTHTMKYDGSDDEAIVQESDTKNLNKMKKKHLSKLGLQAIDFQKAKVSTNEPQASVKMDKNKFTNQEEDEETKQQDDDIEKCRDDEEIEGTFVDEESDVDYEDQGSDYNSGNTSAHSRRKRSAKIKTNTGVKIKENLAQDDENQEHEDVEECGDDDELEEPYESDDDEEFHLGNNGTSRRLRRSAKHKTEAKVKENPEQDDEKESPRRSDRLKRVYYDDAHQYASEHSEIEDAEEQESPRRSDRLKRVYYDDAHQYASEHSEIEDAEEQESPRRSDRLKRVYYDDAHQYASEHSEIEDAEEQESPRRSDRLKRVYYDDAHQYASEHSEIEDAEEQEPMDGDEGEEAACPEDDDNPNGTCFCEEPSNMYATDLEEPVFCRAIDQVDEVRVGCSHRAAKAADGSYLPLVRAGPRTPYILACDLHRKLMRRHMCCASCGLFCTQGIFYQCSEKHLFHIDCGLFPTRRASPGCPHCGVHEYRWWQPANRACCRVRLDMHCSNKRVYLPDQREQCTPAYLSFSKLDQSTLDLDPVLLEDLIPGVDLQKLKELAVQGEKSTADEVRDAIANRETVDELLPKILSADLTDPLEGSQCAQIAASTGNVTALALLRHCGVDLDGLDQNGRTPLMAAVLALLEKTESKVKGMNKELKTPEKESDILDDKESLKSEKDDNKKEKTVSEDNLMKVIDYLIAVGCDVNIPGPEGMTALHLSSQLGGAAVTSSLLRAGCAQLDPLDVGGWTPLVWAAENNHTDVVRVLLRAGAAPSPRDGEGNAVLHWCALAGAAKPLALLLQCTDTHRIDDQNAHGDTPLHVAARQGHYQCVVMLLARGARTDITNSAGELPVDVSTGECEAAITLNMQLKAKVKGTSKYTLVSSDISLGREQFPVPCVNEVDDAVLPADFRYVTRHVLSNNIDIDRSLATAQGCLCAGECGSECACAMLSVRGWWARGALRGSFPHHDPPMLFLCNETCGCDLRKCPNASLTLQSRAGALFVRAGVYRLAGARGWGLRATRAVARGCPVAAYTGELVTAAQADARPDDHYMFALDLKADLLEQCSDKTQLCVDAATYGSAARFMNHSCRPNTAPVRVFTHARDLRLPMITLFATRDIKPMEELTFDYGDKFWSVKAKWMKCECGAPECRYPTILQEEST